MAKRFSDTEKYKDPWFRNLKPSLKTLFLFMCDDCNHAGVWKENFKIFELMFEYIVTHKDLKGFGDKVVRIDEDTYLLVNFIRFQYGKLNVANKAHLGVVRALEYVGVNPDEYIAPSKPLPRCTGVGVGVGVGVGTGIGIGVGIGTDNDLTSSTIPF